MKMIGSKAALAMALALLATGLVEHIDSFGHEPELPLAREGTHIIHGGTLRFAFVTPFGRQEIIEL